MSEYNEDTYRRMLKAAERRGENVVFVLEASDFELGGVNVYKVSVPGELYRQQHFICWFMYLPQFHGPKDVGDDPAYSVTLDARGRNLSAGLVCEQDV